MFAFIRPLVALSLLIASALAPALESVRFATNWRAQAAHGGFYQALVDGTYARHGLEVSILQGGPQINTAALLPAGRVDFLMTGNLLHHFDAVRNGLPVVAVAAMFQKDPQALFAHPDQGYEDFAKLRSAPVAFIAKDAQFSWWQWLKSAHGFSDEQLRPYNYSLAPFLRNAGSIQQGYAVAEPIYIKAQGGFSPVVHLLADHGFSTYSTLIATRPETIVKRRSLVARFVKASSEGWAAYLKGDRRAANARMMADNPEMTEAELEAAVTLMKDMGLVDSGDAATHGIGVMRRARIVDFLEKMVRAGLYKPGEVDVDKVADLSFVDSEGTPSP